MNKLFSKPSLLLGLLAFLFFALPKQSYNPDFTINIKPNSGLFANKYPMEKGHQKFILNLIPLVKKSNQDVLQERKSLEQILEAVETNKEIRLPEQRWVNSLARKYRGDRNFDLTNIGKEEQIEYLKELLSRVDIIPIRLALAQAAIESGWGKSRFCVEGNAYFGIHCYNPGCGLTAEESIEEDIAVKAYESAQESVSDYILFLNSKRGMQAFRDERMNYLYNHSGTSLSKLAESITGYSENGEAYSQMINSILRNYIPDSISDF